MLFKKIFALVFCSLLVAQISAQTDVKKDELNEETVKKTAALLSDLARDGEQFSLPVNRINARIMAGALLWQHDEKQARAVFQSAINELNQMISQIPDVNAESGEDYNSERYLILNDARNLRSDLLVALAPRDPAFALETLQALSRKTPDGASLFEDDKTLEISLAEEIAAKDPKKAYEVAKKNLDEAFNYGIFTALSSLYEKDAELGAKLAQDIAAKIKSGNTKIASAADYAGEAVTTNSNTMTKPAPESQPINVWDVQTFLDTVKKLNQSAAKNKKKPVLSESETKEIVEIIAQIFIRQQYVSAYEVSRTLPEINRYFPSLAQAVRRKINETELASLNGLVSKQIFQDEIANKSSDEILQIIEKKPAAEKDELYYKAAELAFAEGKSEDAKKFYAKMKGKPEYDYLGKSIEDALPMTLAAKGDSREVRELLGKLKTPEEKIEVLTTLSVAVAKSGDKKTASTLLNEARSTYSGKMKNRKNLASVLQISQALVYLEPEQAFNFIESNFSFFNDLINAAVMLDEFNDGGAAQEGELRLDAVERESYRNVPKAVALLKSLAAVDFDRTAALAEKFSRPEARFLARYRIADSLLNPNAEKEEKEFQIAVEGEYEGH